MTQIVKPVFVYVRNTPKTMMLFASTNIKPTGERKQYLSDDHPQFKRVKRVLETMDVFLRTKYPGRRVTLDKIARYVGIPDVELVYLSAHYNASERILLKFETHH